MPVRTRARTPAPYEGRSPWQALVHSSQQLHAERELETLSTQMVREAAQLLQAERASVFVLDRARSELWSLTALDSDPLQFDARLGIAGASALTGQLLNVADAPRDPRFYPGIDVQMGYHTRTVLAVPLRTTAGEVLGVFEVLNKRAGTFSAADEELATAFAAHAALALETAQLVQGLRQQQERLLAENAQLRGEQEGRLSTQALLGTSPPIQQLVRLLERLRDTAVDVLITGESGTGKELVAKLLHSTSPRARQPWVALNCGALPENLVESELFGIERGVATGVDFRIGKFEAARGGTLFLDEVGDLSLAAQVKLLRALQERVIERVGGRHPIPVDVRVLAATHKDLAAEIAKGAFRDDLYYRLNVIHIQLPPLREIREDLPLLARYFLARAGQEFQKTPPQLAPEALDCLLTYAWPGNVRELANEMKRLVVLARSGEVTPADLSEAMRPGGGPGRRLPAAAGCSLKAIIADVEQRLIQEALQACGGNQRQAAKRLGLSRQGLRKKLQRYGLLTGPPSRAGAS